LSPLANSRTFTVRTGSNGHLTLPYRARLTPLGNDWVRAKKIVIGYSDLPTPVNGGGAPGAKPPAAELAESSGGAFWWWCDGPCGPAKAAIIAHEKESGLKALDKPADAKQLVR